jgi:hypothetical protein
MTATAPNTASSKIYAQAQVMQPAGVAEPDECRALIMPHTELIADKPADREALQVGAAAQYAQCPPTDKKQDMHIYAALAQDAARQPAMQDCFLNHVNIRRYDS